MVTANPHGDWEAYCERTQQEADETLARSGHLEHTGDGPIAEGWQLTVGHGHSGFGIYAHMEEYPEEGAIFWRSLNDVQTDAYADGRKDEREALIEFVFSVRESIGAGAAAREAQYERAKVEPYLDAVIDEMRTSGATGVGGGVRSSPLSGSIPESSTTWRPIETAPEDENVLVATTGGWVDTAFWTDDGDGPKWWWLLSASVYARHPIHPDLVPTHWMPLPKHPEEA
jgi:hypothetical protein